MGFLKLKVVSYHRKIKFLHFSNNDDFYVVNNIKNINIIKEIEFVILFINLLTIEINGKSYIDL